jgi:leader peptidase (prepilin peptidase) / N-methyltransferase
MHHRVTGAISMVGVQRVSPWALPVVALAGGGAAGALVRAYGSSERTTSLWWLAALGAGGAAVLGTWSSTPAAAAIAAVGLAAAALIDAVETRIPTTLAHGTTAASALALAYDAWRSADWAPAWTAAACTAAVVVVFLVLWFVGGMGYGDVRLAASTVTASTSGPVGAVTLLWGAFATADVTAVVQSRRGERRSPVPFGPALAVGWLLAVTLT